MLSTFVFAIISIGVWLLNAVLWAILLRLGLHWGKVPNVTMRRIGIVSAIMCVFGIAISILVLIYSPSGNLQLILIGIVQLLTATVVPWAVIKTAFGTRDWQTIQAWLPTLLAPFGVLLFVLVVLRPLLYETFSVNGAAMAPNLLGTHWIDKCPECGQSCYCSPRDGRQTKRASMICASYHVSEFADLDQTVHAADRLLAFKYLTPRRWDIVVFRYPASPKQIYVSRLVGLPGEEIRIRNGAVIVDGKEVTPPDNLKGVEYLTSFNDGHPDKFWGTDEQPAKLGKDEFFVLGDFSISSMDSRNWDDFALPKANIIGVVTHRIYPFERWHLFR